MTDDQRQAKGARVFIGTVGSSLGSSFVIPPSPDAGRPWWERFGLAVDRLLNVLLLNGDDTWTVSLHAAAANGQGRRWGCVVCAILSVLVQRDHCAITLDPTRRETTGAALKSGALLALAIAGLAIAVRTFVSLF